MGFIPYIWNLKLLYIMEIEVINRRATLFVGGAPISINEQTLPQFVEIFSKLGLLPSVNKGLGLKITPQGVIQENVISLDMKYLDDTFKVSIGPNRFDIVCTKKAESISDFLRKVDNVTIAISKSYPEPFTRLALCSTVVFNMEAPLLDNVYEKVTNNHDEQPVEWQIRKVLRSKIESDAKPLVINNVYTLSRNITQIGAESPIDRIMLDMDINTIVENNIDVIKQQQSEFWNVASSTIESAIDYYENLILHD